MNTHRKTAIVAGLLFILATVVSVTAMIAMLDPVLNSPDRLDQIVEQREWFVTGILLEMINNGAVIALGVVLFPILRCYSVVLAFAYVALRLAEALFIAIGDLALLSLVSLADNHGAAASANAEIVAHTADMLVSVVDWTLILGPGLFLAANAAILNYILWRTSLIPAVLTLWGMIGAALLLVGDIAVMYGFADNVLYFAALFAVQEMALALWLIAKGFNPGAVRQLGLPQANAA